jgi:ribonuclease HII
MPFYTQNGLQNKAGKIYTATEIEILSSIPSTSIVKEIKFMSIAAASVLAKPIATNI